MNSKKDEPLLSMWTQMSKGSDSEVHNSVIEKIYVCLEQYGYITLIFNLKKI